MADTLLNPQSLLTLHWTDGECTLAETLANDLIAEGRTVISDEEYDLLCRFRTYLRFGCECLTRRLFNDYGTEEMPIIRRDYPKVQVRRLSHVLGRLDELLVYIRIRRGIPDADCIMRCPVLTDDEKECANRLMDQEQQRGEEPIPTFSDQEITTLRNMRAKLSFEAQERILEIHFAIIDREPFGVLTGSAARIWTGLCNIDRILRAAGMPTSHNV